jgi:Tfp pilus assembly protein FimT
MQTMHSRYPGGIYRIRRACTLIELLVVIAISRLITMNRASRFAFYEYYHTRGN